MDDEDVSDQQHCPSTEGMLELENLTLGTTANDPFAPLADGLDDEDSDSDNDEGISSSYHPSAQPAQAPVKLTYFLGHTFDADRDRFAMSKFSKSLYWFTYRNDLVVPLRPYAATNAQSLVGNITHGGGLSGVTGDGGMKSDAGWGCMLRSAQMMLAQAVRRHFSPETSGEAATGTRRVGSIRHSLKSTDRVGCRDGGVMGSSGNIEHHRLNWRQLEDPWEVERIAKWFADFPNHPNVFHDNEEDTGNIIDDSTKEGEIKNCIKNDAQDSDSDHDDPTKEYGKGGLNYHWYSLHQMVAAGLGLGILPGEWYGPTTACHVLRELNEIHCERRERLARTLNQRNRRGNDHKHRLTCDMFRVHVATEGCIYLDAISELMTGRSNSDGSSDGNEDKHGSWSKIDHDPLSLDDPLRPTPQQQTNDSTNEDVQWNASLLLLLPLRLGIQSISTANYGSTLAKLISFPHSVGLLGGTPRHALWFYGADAVDASPSQSADTNSGVGGWYGLDPHTVQSAPRGTQALVESKSVHNGSSGERSEVPPAAPTYQWQVQLTDSYLRSLHFSSTNSHSNNERSIPLSNLDPSCALGFYIRDHSDFLYFQRLLKGLLEEHCRPNKLPEIVTVLEKTPNYEVDVSTAMNGMIGKSEVDDLDGFSMNSEEEKGDDALGEEEDDDDDDDFVLI